MVFKQDQRYMQYREVRNLVGAYPQLSSARPPFGVGRQTSESAPSRMPVRNAVISIGIVDEKSLSRECLTRSLQALDERFDIMSFATCDDCLQSIEHHDLVLYHVHANVTDWENDDQRLSSFKKLRDNIPLIILSDIDCPDALMEIFESGVRGFIPTTDTTLDQIIGIIEFVKVGGIFVPQSSLSLQRTTNPRARAVSSNQFTGIQLAVLDRLKLGKANKIIAHELGVSESTVKVHIGRMMKKLKAANRTQLVSRAYALAADNTQSQGEARQAGLPGGDPH
jgi:DNA-binding NarL/FixJ family response regulator